MSWGTVNYWSYTTRPCIEDEKLLLNPTFLPVTETEILAREIIKIPDYSDSYLNDLLEKIKKSLELLDLFRETGFILSSPESVLENLEDMCSMF